MVINSWLVWPRSAWEGSTPIYDGKMLGRIFRWPWYEVNLLVLMTKFQKLLTPAKICWSWSILWLSFDSLIKIHEAMYTIWKRRTCQWWPWLYHNHRYPLHWHTSCGTSFGNDSSALLRTSLQHKLDYQSMALMPALDPAWSEGISGEFHWYSQKLNQGPPQKLRCGSHLKIPLAFEKSMTMHQETPQRLEKMKYFFQVFFNEKLLNIAWTSSKSFYL